MAVSSIVSRFPASKTSPFLHALRVFNRGEFGQRDGIYIHGIWVVMGARGSIIVGRGSSLAKILDANKLGVENLGLIDPSLDGGGN